MDHICPPPPPPLRPAALRAAVGGEVALGDEEARALFEALHHNIYRAFDYERDEQVYDALAESVAGPLLDWTFQEVAGALTLREEGGARAKVTLVRPLRWERLPLLDREREVLGALSASLTRGAFACAYRWRVVGEVTHWGHTHRRVNEHEARYVVAHTPKGWRNDQLSMPRPTDSVNSPFRRCGMPQANSTTSRPRWIEPLASEITLPCSEESSFASSSMFFSISSLNLNMTRARTCGFFAAQPRKAFSATAMALRTSSADA